MASYPSPEYIWCWQRDLICLIAPSPSSDTALVSLLCKWAFHISSFPQARSAEVAFTSPAPLNLEGQFTKFTYNNTCSLWSNTTVWRTTLQKLSSTPSQQQPGCNSRCWSQQTRQFWPFAYTLCICQSRTGTPHPTSCSPLQERQWYWSKLSKAQPGRMVKRTGFVHPKQVQTDLTAVCSYFIHRRGQGASGTHTGAGQETTATIWNMGNSNWEGKVVIRLKLVWNPYPWRPIQLN